MESSTSAPRGTEEAGDNNIIIKEDIIANNANDAVSDGDDSSVTSNEEDLEEGYDSEERDPAIEESIQNIIVLLIRIFSIFAHEILCWCQNGPR